jgi:hypothetical protein
LIGLLVVFGGGQSPVRGAEDPSLAFWAAKSKSEAFLNIEFLE